VIYVLLERLFVSYTPVTVTETAAITGTTSVTGVDTTIVPVDSDAISSEICPFSSDFSLKVGATKKHQGIRISMDGQGRWRDNVFIERLWKTVKYQEVYLKAYESISHARKELTKFFDRYNMRRPHQGLDDRTPDEVYWSPLPRVRDAV